MTEKFDFDVLSKAPVEGKVVDAEWAPKERDPFNLEALKAALTPYKAQVDSMAQKMMDLKITDDASNLLAVTYGTQAKKLFKDIDAARKKAIKEAAEIVNGVNTTVRPFAKTLAALDTTAKRKIAAYHKEQAELARRIAQKKARDEAVVKRAAAEQLRQDDLDRQRKERAEAITRKAELEEKAKAAGVEPVEVLIPEIVEPEIIPIVEDIVLDKEPVRTDDGTAGFIQKFKFTVIDLELVPPDFIMVIRQLDEIRVKQAIDAGIREIAGLEITEEYDVRFRTK